jgi:sulfoxide reductase heme-binding subunit YedZ
MNLVSLLPWTDRTGRFQPLKLACFVVLVLPFLWLIAEAAFDLLGVKPVTEAIHQSGDWAIRFLILSLAVTPLRQIAHWNELITLRRMIGLASLFYALLHLSLYALSQGGDWGKIVSEIVSRFYLTLGISVVLGLVALGVTSNAAAIRRLGGKNWNRLHRIVYVLALCGLVHYFLQIRLDASGAVLWAGIFFWLMAWRAIRWSGGKAGPLGLLALALGAGGVTALCDAGYYWVAKSVDPLLVLQAQLDFDTGLRPAWQVAAVALLIVPLALLRRGKRGKV